MYTGMCIMYHVIYVCGKEKEDIFLSKSIYSLQAETR